jgi:hypothetical protein
MMRAPRIYLSNTFEEWLEKYGPVNNPEATDSFINLFDGVSAFSDGTAL